MDISIIIPNYNGEHLLKENLPKVLSAVREYKKGKIEFVISDDASSDTSVVVAEEFLKRLEGSRITGKIVKSTSRKDGGFSKNVNRGVRAATGDILLLLNTDVAPRKGFLTPLLSHFENKNVFAVGCMDESIEEGKVVLRGRGIGRWEKGFLMHSAGRLDREKTLWVSGGSGAFRKSVWDKLGGLNELYNPFYWEDIDLSYRAQKAGYLTIFENGSRVIHEHSKGTIQTHFKPYNIQKIVYRNQFSFVWLNITDANLLFSHLLWLPYHFLNTIRSKDKAFLAGFFMAAGRIPSIISYRRHMKKLFQKTDKAVLENYSQ